MGIDQIPFHRELLLMTKCLPLLSKFLPLEPKGPYRLENQA